MKAQQIAAQLYTVRDQMKTPAEIVAGLRRIRQIGYAAVQVSGIGPIPVDDLAQALRDEGLVCCATHEPGDELLNHPERVAAKLHQLGSRITAYPYPGGISFATLADVKAFAARLDHAGSAFREAGIDLCYHNHHIEFQRVEGHLVLDVIFSETDPRHVQAELDTYWVQFGGGDPVDWCRRMKGRLPTLHLKDYVVNAQNQVVFAEVGSGNLAWPSILEAADAAGCPWFIVEQDICPGDPFESLRKSYQFLKSHVAP